MNIIYIDSLNIPDLQPFRELRANRFGNDNSFVADSARVVEMLLKAGIEPVSLLCTENYLSKQKEFLKSFNIPTVYIGSKKTMQSITGHTIHHGIMLHAKRPANIPLKEMPDNIIMLSGLSNMENVGAIARSAAALGVRGYAVPSNGPHPYGRRAVRVSTGHIAKLKLHIFDDIIDCIKSLKRTGYHIISAESCHNSIPLSVYKPISDRWVLIMGNEENGIPDEILKLSDKIVEIEMEPGIKSMNVSIAASIVMYYLRMK